MASQSRRELILAAMIRVVGSKGRKAAKESGAPTRDVDARKPSFFRRLVSASSGHVGAHTEVHAVRGISFVARHGGVSGLSRVSHDLLLRLYLNTDESHELGDAFRGRRKPDADKFGH